MHDEKANCPKRYSTKTEGAVRAALLKLLAKKALPDITVAELSREAQVSRSTFYEHYRNPAEVYDDIVKEFSHDLSPLLDQVSCTHDMRPQGKPFCALLREDGPYRAAVKEDRFLGTFLSDTANFQNHDLYAMLVNRGYSADQAKAICAFQLSGCFTASRIVNVEDAEWPEVKAAIDRFILGGIAACLAQPS